MMDKDTDEDGLNQVLQTSNSMVKEQEKYKKELEGIIHKSTEGDAKESYMAFDNLNLQENEREFDLLDTQQ